MLLGLCKVRIYKKYPALYQFYFKRSHDSLKTELTYFYLFLSLKLCQHLRIMLVKSLKTKRISMKQSLGTIRLSVFMLKLDMVI